MDVNIGITTINFDEIEFYTDLAMNESQRWIEVVTRERFFDEDDFLYSLRHGTQLRKVLNIVRPGCISLVSCSELPSCSREQFYDDNSDHSDEDEIKPWTVQFLTVCRTVLNFNDRQIFRASDLDALIDENGRQGCLPVETLSKIRRVVINIYELAVLCESLPSYIGPKIDKTAVEPLVNYHRRIINDETISNGFLSPKQELLSKNLYRILQKDVKFVLNTILDSICTEEESSRSSAETREELEQIEKHNKGKLEQVKKNNEEESTKSVSSNSKHFIETNEKVVVADCVPSEKSTNSDSSISPILLSRDRTFREKVSNYLNDNDFLAVTNDFPAVTNDFPSVTNDFRAVTKQMSSSDQDYRFSEYSPKSPISPGGRSDNVFYGSAADLSREYRPANYQQREFNGNSSEDLIVIPTRTLTKSTNVIPSRQALKFVSSHSHLAETAKEQIDKMNAQHVSREQLQKEDDFQKEWKNDFESWADKRRAKSISALRRKSDREDVERLPTPTANKTGYFNKSPPGAGRSLNDVRYDYDRQDDQDEDRRQTVNVSRTNFNSSASDYHDDNKRSFGEPPRATMKQYGLEVTNGREETNYYPDSEDDGKSSGHYQSTPLHSATSSMDNSLSPQREPIIETVRETTKTYEKRTTYIPQTSTNAKSHFNTMTSSSQQQNTHSKQTLSYDRSPINPTSRLIQLENDPDSGVEMNHASPMSSPMRCDDSLSPNSQSSTDGGKSIHHHHHHVHQHSAPVQDTRRSSTNTPLLEMAPSVQYVQTTRTENKNYDQFSINIKQRINSDKGFGFTLKGGKDKHEPILVATVIAGSSADKSRLQINDEVVEINGEPVADKVLGAVNLHLREAVRTGEIDILLRRKLPKILDTATQGKPIISPRFSRKQTSFDETRDRFEREKLKNETTSSKNAVPGKLPTYGVFHQSRSTSSGSGSGSASPAKMNVVQQRSSPKFDYSKTSPKETSYSKNSQYIRSPQFQRRDPGRITDFVPEVDRQETSEYKLTFSQGRQSPGRILDFVPDSERPKSHRPVYTQGDDDELDSAWNRERRIILGSGDPSHQHHPSVDAEYHDAPQSHVHYDHPIVRPVGGDNYSVSSSDSRSINRLNSSTNDAPIVPVYHNKSVAAMKVSKALNSKVQTPNVVYETTYVEESNSLPSVSSPTSQKFNKPVHEVSSLSHQSGNLTEYASPERNSGSDTMSFLESKFRRMNSTRRLRNRLKTARSNYYGISRTVDDGSGSSDDSFDISPYLKRVEDCKLYDMASKLITTSGTDLFFKGHPTQFTYDLKRQQVPSSSKLLSSPKPAVRRRTVVVVPVRTKDMRIQSDGPAERLNSTSSYVASTPRDGPAERLNSTTSYVVPTPRVLETPAPRSLDSPTPYGLVPTPRVIDTPTPYSHVKREPVSFSLEPIPGVLANGQQKPKPAARVHNDAMPLYSKETALNEIERVFGHRDTTERLNGTNSAEMRYLELASMENAKSASIPRPMPHNDNINEHWMVREAEDLRLSDQLRAEQSRVNRQSVESNNLIDLDVNAYRQTQYPYQVNAVPQRQTIEGNGLIDFDTNTYQHAQYPYQLNTIAQLRNDNDDYNYDGAEYSTRAFAETNGYSMLQRPPSPKFPPNSILNQRFGTRLSTDEENRIVAVSDRQICAHCNKELGRGAAMTIESLGLYYHLNCFKCYVCQVPLGDGIHGADVRVKDRRLNCQSCYTDQTGAAYTEL